MKENYTSGKENVERRFLSPQIEMREDGGIKTIEGIAAVVNKNTNLGWFEERVAPGAFDDVLNDDVVALFNHDPNFPLARTTAKGDGKLELFLNENGDLGYRFNIPNTTAGRDLAENIRLEVISKSSFAFTIDKEEWLNANKAEGRDNDVRVIKKLKRLYDVSPVTYPAYNDTAVAARSLEKIKNSEDEHRKKLDEQKKRRQQLKRGILNIETK
jgi:HK97 family phage prohead protease